MQIFLRKAVRVGGFPFDVNIDDSNKETMEAVVEAEHIAKNSNVKAYFVEDAFQELDHE